MGKERTGDKGHFRAVRVPERLRCLAGGSRIVAIVLLSESFTLMAELHSKQFCCDSQNYIHAVKSQKSILASLPT